MKLINIRSYDNYIDANLAVGFLESEGIASYLMDENTASILPSINYIFGDIKLQVWENDYAKSIAMFEAEDARKKRLMQCPNCGSHDVQFMVAAKPKNWISAILTFSFFSVPLGIENSYHCFSCNHEFKKLE